MTDSIELVDIHKCFGDVDALNGVTLTIEPGEFVAVMGASGSGKTTLLRCINHLELIDTGKIAIGGTVVAETRNGKASYCAEGKIRQALTSTTMVFQEAQLFGHLTCLQNITSAPLQMKKGNPKKINERARGLLREMNLENKTDAYPGSLSGSQKQLIAIARAIIIDPSILLFDASIAAFDPKTAGKIFDMTRQLAQRGCTIILVTHNRGFAEKAADRIVYMDNGKIVA